MHLATIAAILFSALTVSAQAAGSDAQDTTELLEEFAKLPTCVVCASSEFFWSSKTPLADPGSDDLHRKSTPSLNVR